MACVASVVVRTWWSSPEELSVGRVGGGGGEERSDDETGNRRCLSESFPLSPVLVAGWNLMYTY